MLCLQQVSQGNACQVGFGTYDLWISYAPYNDLKAFEDACTENTIAIMIEPVQGEGGVHPATKEFMTGLRSSVMNTICFFLSMRFRQAGAEQVQ